MVRGMVILAGGSASRMKRNDPASAVIESTLLEQAEKRTKGMIGVGSSGRPLSEYQLFNAWKSGIREILFVTGESAPELRDFFGPLDRGNIFRGLDLSYVVQPVPNGRIKPLGTADALWRAILAKPEWSGDGFIVCNSDNLYSTRAISALCALDCGGLVGYQRHGLKFTKERIAQFGIIEADDQGYLLRIHEKPDQNEFEERITESVVSMNIFRFDYDLALPYMENCTLHPVRDEKELPAAVNDLVLEYPRSMKVVPLMEHVPDLTRKEDIPHMTAYLDEQFGDRLWDDE